jgi:hypothetical protein
MNVAMDISVSEARGVYPLEEDFLKTYSRTAIGKNDDYILRWINHQRARGWCWISIDFSKFDSTIPAWLLKAAFTIARAAFKVKDERLFDVWEHDFIHKTLILSDRMLEIHHGTPSGSRFTSVINGIVNEIITESVLAKFSLEGTFMCMGDDNLLFLNCPVSDGLVKEIAQYISKVFGITVHPHKCSFGTYANNPEFLSREWTQRGPWRPMEEILSLAMYPERFRDYGEKDVDGQYLRTPQQVLEGYWMGYKLNFEDFLKPSILEQGMHTIDFKRDYSEAKLETLSYHLRTWYEREHHRYKWLNATA